MGGAARSPGDGVLSWCLCLLRPPCGLWPQCGQDAGARSCLQQVGMCGGLPLCEGEPQGRTSARWQYRAPWASQTLRAIPLVASACRKPTWCTQSLGAVDKCLQCSGRLSKPQRRSGASMGHACDVHMACTTGLLGLTHPAGPYVGIISGAQEVS